MSIEGAIFCKYPQNIGIIAWKVSQFSKFVDYCVQWVYYFAINKGEMTYEKIQKART